MKYIRTKDGKILELARFHERTTPIMKEMGYITLIDRLKTRDYEISVKDIINQADTIEELCDEFVCEHNNGTRVMQSKECKPQFPFCKDTIDYIKRNNHTYYGAIWTDKGLIYVAKMNDKGELELL